MSEWNPAAKAWVDEHFQGSMPAIRAMLMLAYEAGFDAAKAIASDWARGEADRMYDEMIRERAANHPG